MTTTIKPHFSLTKETLENFDSLMFRKLGYEFEGTLNESLWIYRKSENEIISIQVGFGGVLSVTIIISNQDGFFIKRNPVEMKGINTPEKLVKKLQKDLLVLI